MSSVSVQNVASLRHCPFCGGCDLESVPIYGDDGRWSVYCARCECTGPVADSKHYAAEIWNHGTSEFKEVG